MGGDAPARGAADAGGRLDNMPAVSRPMPFLIAGAAAAVLAITACGTEKINADNSQPLSPVHQGAELFNQRCGGCHTFDPGGTEGSSVNVRTREYKDGPNFNQRKEQYDAVLYAIRNGGFSSGPMPQNIVTGPEAEALAKFVSENSAPDTAGGKGPDCPAA